MSLSGLGCRSRQFDRATGGDVGGELAQRGRGQAHTQRCQAAAQRGPDLGGGSSPVRAGQGAQYRGGVAAALLFHLPRHADPGGPRTAPGSGDAPGAGVVVVDVVAVVVVFPVCVLMPSSQMSNPCSRHDSSSPGLPATTRRDRLRGRAAGDRRFRRGTGRPAPARRPGTTPSTPNCLSNPPDAGGGMLLGPILVFAYRVRTSSSLASAAAPEAPTGRPPWPSPPRS